MSIDMTASLKGTLCRQGSFGSIIFHTPGSAGIPSTEKAQYPIYNEALGIFNIIDTPQVILKQTPLGVWSPVPQCNQYYQQGCPYLPYYKNEYRLKQSIKYVLNPASNLQIKEAQGAFIIETRDSLPISGTGNYAWNVLGKNALTNKWLQSTRLIGIDTLSDFIFNFQYAPGGGLGVQGVLGNAFVQIVMRLTKIGDTIGIIYSARYPAQLVTHNASIPATDIGTVANGTTAYPNFFIPPTTQEISDFCTGPKYKNRDRLYSRVADQLTNRISEHSIQDINLNVYPNPTSNSLNIEFFNSKTQYVKIKISNLLGQEVREISSGTIPEGLVRKSYNISDLSNGIVLVIIETGNQIISKKIVIVK
jgi:hypothetical protein